MPADKMRDELYDKVCNLTAELAEAEKQRAQFEACSKINALSQASWANRAEKAEAKLAEAEKVMEPFAWHVVMIGKDVPDHPPTLISVNVWAKDLRAARAWLERRRTGGERK